MCLNVYKNNNNKIIVKTIDFSSRAFFLLQIMCIAARPLQYCVSCNTAHHPTRKHWTRGAPNPRGVPNPRGTPNARGAPHLVLTAAGVSPERMKKQLSPHPLSLRHWSEMCLPQVLVCLRQHLTGHLFSFLEYGCQRSLSSLPHREGSPQSGSQNGRDGEVRGPWAPVCLSARWPECWTLHSTRPSMSRVDWLGHHMQRLQMIGQISPSACKWRQSHRWWRQRGHWEVRIPPSSHAPPWSVNASFSLILPKICWSLLER